ncbi:MULTISPECIES: DUF4192 family protein [Rhodococcus erythropolis group]|uniref:DUF4192 family protein n=1 Tax=Rhodococcus baikonurensis TaxID=172041 RepID=A0ABV5XG00_9NOCA|nr:DUF4192 family protein [Rhodococcus qingshengii]
MSTFRLSSPSDCVAGAVALGGHIPVDEVVVIALDLEPMPVAMIKLTDVESGRVLANLEGATPFAQCREMLVVVFGPIERGDAVGEVFEQFRPDAVTPVYVFTEGVVRRWHGVGSLAVQAGDQMDLRSHPIVLEAQSLGVATLQTRAQMRTAFEPAQFGAERAAAVAQGFDEERAKLAAMDPHGAAELAFTSGLAPYIGRAKNDGGIVVTDEHAALIAAAMHDVTVRDLLFVHVTDKNADAAAEMLRQVGALLPANLAGPVIIIGAIFHWVARHAALSREALIVGRTLDPAHSFGQLFERALDFGMNPALWDQLRTAAVTASTRTGR